MDVRFETDPDNGAEMVLISDSATRIVIARILINVILLCCLPLVVFYAIRSGATEAFVAVLCSILILTGILGSHMPSRRPLILTSQQFIVRVTGASAAVHWDGVERIGVVSYPGWNTDPALAFFLRPGASARDLVHASGWFGERLVKDNVVYVRRIPLRLIDEVESVAGSLHRKRLEETSRMESPMNIVPPYPSD